MPEHRDLTPERLSLLLQKLNDVMSEASRLRREITRQLDDQRRTIQQKVTPARKKVAKRR